MHYRHFSGLDKGERKSFRCGRVDENFGTTKDTIHGFKEVSQVIKFLDEVALEGDSSKDIVMIYEGLEKLGIVQQSDVVWVKAFTEDLATL